MRVLSELFAMKTCQLEDNEGECFTPSHEMNEEDCGDDREALRGRGGEERQQER